MTEYACDVAIFGGGIAGLWTYQTLLARGYHPILIERDTLGGRQTLAAQGILHGGMKYALDGKVDDITLRLREMPEQWLRCIRGEGEIDLTGTEITSPSQVMWSDGGVFSRISSAVGSKMLHGDVATLNQADWPEVFRANQYKGTLRVLRETVVDVKSVVRALARPGSGGIYRANGVDLKFDGGKLTGAALFAPNHAPCFLKAQVAIFTAGCGNEGPAAQLPIPQPATQRRPLRQILIKGVPWKLWGHCIVADPKPRITVTSHCLPNGEIVWYLGGNVAEKSAAMDETAALRFARKEMAAIFPATDWSRFAWATWSVDRAEPHQSTRFMPSEPTLTISENCLLAWPTKLVFAPGLARRVLTEVQSREIQPQPAPTLPLPAAEVGKFPWELAEWQAPEPRQTE